MIEFEDVTKQYPDGTVAVDKLSLRIPSNEITVFVGPSGCGKTTSLRMINRTIERSSGRISIDGEDINSGDPVTLRRGIGYVIQHAGLFPHKTVVDNIATVPKLLGWDKAKTRSVAMELLERVGLDVKLARALSGPAVWWPAATSRRGPGARGGSQDHADGRAVQRGRPDRAAPAAGGTAPAATRYRQDDRVRHARHRRGDQAR